MEHEPRRCGSCKRPTFEWPTLDDRSVALCRKCDYAVPTLTLDDMGFDFNLLEGNDA